MENKDTSLAYGCLFCRCGSEDRLRSQLMSLNPRIEAVVATRKRIRIIRGERAEESVPLFPGYVFFSAPDELDMPELLKRQGLSGALIRHDGRWALHGRDRSLAEFLFDHGGCVGISRARYQDGRLTVIDGPLKAFEASIVSVNQKTRAARVRTDLFGVTIPLWFGLEIVHTNPLIKSD